MSAPTNCLSLEYYCDPSLYELSELVKTEREGPNELSSVCSARFGAVDDEQSCRVQNIHHMC